jgi:hypothetical protein
VVEYYHLELDDHDVVIAGGAAAESYREDGKSPLFQNAATRPARPPMPPFAPVLHTHPMVKRIWRELNERAGQPDLALVDDPDLHLLADGTRLDAEAIDQRIWRFRLGSPVSDLHRLSECDPLDDRHRPGPAPAGRRVAAYRAGAARTQAGDRLG